MVKTLPSNAGATGLNPDWGTKSPCVGKKKKRSWKGRKDHLGQGLANSSVKGWRITISSFAGHMVCVTATQQQPCGLKAATDNTETEENGCVPTKLYLQKQATSRTWLLDISLLTSNLVQLPHFTDKEKETREDWEFPRVTR